MAFLYALDPATPLNTDPAKEGALHIRNLESALRERLGSFFADVDADPFQVKAGATFQGGATFGAGITVNAGTSAFQAITATTTVSFSGAGIAAVLNNTPQVYNQTGVGLTLSGLAVELRYNAGVLGLQLMSTGLLAFGGTSSAFPALKRVGAALHARLADDSALAGLAAATLILGADPGGSELLRVGGSARFNGTLTVADYYRFSANAANPSDTTASLYNQAGIGPTISGLNFAVRTGATTPVERLRVNPDGSVVVGADPGGSEILRIGGGVRFNGTLASLSVGGGVTITALLSATVTWDPGPIDPGISATQDVTITGAAVGDLVVATNEWMNEVDITFDAFVVSANTVRLLMRNNSAIQINPLSHTTRVLVFKV